MPEIIFNLNADDIIVLDGLCDFFQQSKEEIIRLALLKLSVNTMIIDKREEAKKAK